MPKDNQQDPSPESLAEMPEMNLERAERRNPYIRRIENENAQLIKDLHAARNELTRLSGERDEWCKKYTDIGARLERSMIVTWLYKDACQHDCNYCEVVLAKADDIERGQHRKSDDE